MYRLSPVKTDFNGRFFQSKIIRQRNSPQNDIIQNVATSNLWKISGFHNRNSLTRPNFKFNHRCRYTWNEKLTLFLLSLHHNMQTKCRHTFNLIHMIPSDDDFIIMTDQVLREIKIRKNKASELDSVLNYPRRRSPHIPYRTLSNSTTPHFLFPWKTACIISIHKTSKNKTICSYHQTNSLQTLYPTLF